VNQAAAPNARLAALSLLASVLEQGNNLSEVPADGMPADARDRAFSRHLAFGVLRWLTALQWLAERLLQRPLKRRDSDIQRLILLGLFQLWQDQAAAHAAVHESAECARLIGKPWAVGLVNAVLRRFQREQDSLLDQLGQHDERFAHPAWLLDALRDDWPDDWQSVLSANNRQPPLWLRLRHDRDSAGLLREFAAQGFSVAPCAFAPEACLVHPAAAVEALPGFADGRCSVQDAAAQLAAGLLKVEPGQRVLDACAAPGGKTGHLLERLPDLELWAIDRSPERLQRVRENLKRLGLLHYPGLHLLAGDATEPGSWWDGRRFERILLDAPCSATGVIRRHPEIRWLRSPEQVKEAVSLQGTLLRTLWPLLQPGGILLYATCSVLRAENSSQLERFVASCPDAAVDDLDVAWGRRSGPGRQILPGEQDMDGFYYARLRKA